MIRRWIPVILTIVLFSMVVSIALAEKLPVRFYVPDRKLTPAEQRYVNSVPDVHPNSGIIGLRHVAKTLMLRGIRHRPPGGIFVKNTSKDLWEAWQEETNQMYVEHPAHKNPDPPKQACKPELPPCPGPPTEVTVKHPQPPWLPVSAVDDGSKNISSGAVGLTWKHQHPPKEKTCPPNGPPPPEPPVPPDPCPPDPDPPCYQ